MSAYPTDGQQVPSYQQSQCGPFGLRLNDMIARSAEYNVPFDQVQYEEAKLDGCMKEPCAEYPVWPPTKETGFIYPSLEKRNVYDLQGEGLGPMTESVPYVSQPTLETPTDNFPENQYSPETILNMDACQDPLQHLDPALPGMCVGSTPFDATIQSMNDQGIYYSGIAPSEMKNRPESCGSQTQEHFSMRPLNVAVPKHRPDGDFDGDLSGNLDVDIKDIDNDDGDSLRPTLKPALKPTTQPPTQPTAPMYDVRYLPTRMTNTLKGIMYDFSCWDELPKKQNRMRWVLTRDDRWFYLLMWFFVFLIFYYMFRVLWMVSFPSESSSSQASRIGMIVFLGVLAYIFLPEVSGKDNLQKIVSIAVLVIALSFLFTRGSWERTASSRLAVNNPNLVAQPIAPKLADFQRSFF